MCRELLLSARHFLMEMVAFPRKTKRRVKNLESWLELSLSQLSLEVLG